MAVAASTSTHVLYRDRGPSGCDRLSRAGNQNVSVFAKLIVVFIALLKRAEPVNIWIDDEGQLVTRHRRPLNPVEMGEGLRVMTYDPYYYAALRLREDAALPDGCTGQVIRPDTEAADATVAELGWTGDEEGLFDELRVGIHYADILEVTCAGL